MKHILWQGKPFKQLSFGKKKNAGRNSSGCITIFHRGGGSKRLQRRIDFKRNIFPIGIVERIEYDPNRSSRIALIRWARYAAIRALSDDARSVRSYVQRLLLKQPSDVNKITSTWLLTDEIVTNQARSEARRRSASEANDLANAPTSLADAPKRAKQTSEPFLFKTASNGAQHEVAQCKLKKTRYFFSYIIASDQLKPGDEIRNVIVDSNADLYFINGKFVEVRRFEENAFLPRSFVAPSDPATRPAKAACDQSLQERSRVACLLGATKERAARPRSLTLQAASLAAQPSDHFASLVPKARSADDTFASHARSASIRFATNQGRFGAACSSASEDAPTNVAFRSAAKLGTNSPLANISLGSWIHNVELKPGQGGKLVRAAGTFAQLVQKFEKNNQCVIRLPSGTQFLLDMKCRATLGIISNASHNARKLTKAGQRRWMGWKPVVRGVAMNPIDHPHGGGEGRTKGGRPSVSPWGKPSKAGSGRKHNRH